MAEMDYWKYYPDRWLLSNKVRKMTPVAHSGYRFLCDHAMRENPPGMLPFDEDRLRDMARLSGKQWARCRESILGNFETYVKKEGACESFWYGQDFIMTIFREFVRLKHESSLKGVLGANARYKKNGDSTLKMPTHADPYQYYAKKESTKVLSNPSSPTLRLATGGVEADGDTSDGEDGVGPLDHEDLLKMKSALGALKRVNP